MSLFIKSINDNPIKSKYARVADTIFKLPEYCINIANASKKDII